MSRLDNESRAARFIDAMDCLHDLLGGRVPDLTIDAEHLGQLFSLLNDEAKKVVRRHTPGEHAPGITCANDEDYEE